MPDVAFPHEAVLSAPSASRVAGLLALDLNGEPDFSLNLRPNVEDRATGSESAQSLASSTQAAGICARRSARHSALFSLAIFVFLVAALLHAGFRSGSLAAPASVSPGHFEARSEESVMRKNPKSFAVAAAAALSVGAGAAAQDAVQWRVEDGGNGHWYAIVLESDGLSWAAAKTRATAMGGHLATIHSTPEDEFVFQRANQVDAAWSGPGLLGPWLGGSQLDASTEPAGGWTWVTDEAWDYRPPTSWNNGTGLVGCGGHADNGGGGSAENSLHYIDRKRCWNDAKPTGDYFDYGRVCSFAIEWSADCNSDGIVDFGQIRAGELEDANANNVPDCCEGGQSCDPCSADITGNGNVDAADLAAVLSAWGGAPTGKANADVNGDGSVDAADLAAVLSSWGPCP